MGTRPQPKKRINSKGCVFTFDDWPLEKKKKVVYIDQELRDEERVLGC